MSKPSVEKSRARLDAALASRAVSLEVPSALFGRTGVETWVLSVKPDKSGQLVVEMLGSRAVMSPETFEEWARDMRGRPLEGAPRSGDRVVEAVRTGRAELLGKGFEGIVFRVGAEVAKVSTVAPYHPLQGVRTSREAREMLRRNHATVEDLIARGVPGLQRTRLVEHGGKTILVKPYVEIPKRFTREQLLEGKRILIAIHEAGFAIHDEPQLGLENGRVVMFDVGFIGPSQNKRQFQDERDEYAALCRKSGVDCADPQNPGPFFKLDLASAGSALAKGDEVKARNILRRSFEREAKRLPENVLRALITDTVLDLGVDSWRDNVFDVIIEMEDAAGLE